MARPNSPSAEKRTTGSAVRSLQILVAMGDHPDGVTLTDLAARLGVSIATTSRLMAILTDHGFARVDPITKLYSLGLRIFELSKKMHYEHSLMLIARPHLEKLNDVTGLLVALDVLDGFDVLTIDSIESSQIVHVRLSVGDRAPCHSTASGKAMLAFLSDIERLQILKSIRLHRMTRKTITERTKFAAELAKIAKCRVATADGETWDMMRAISAPILGNNNQVYGAVSLVAPTVITSMKELTSNVTALNKATRAIGRRIAL